MSKSKQDALFTALGQERRARVALQDSNKSAANAIYRDLFWHQQQVIDDPYKYKSVLTPRRAGKTHTAISYALIVGLLNPNSRIPILTLTLRSAKRLYWDPIREMAKKYGFGVTLKSTTSECRLENGTVIFLNGAEDRKSIEKLRGGKYRLVVIDECKSFGTALFTELIDDVIDPALADLDGTLVLIGTPGSILEGPFYEATAPGLKDERGYLMTRDYYQPEEFWNDPPKIDVGGKKVAVEPAYSRHHWHTEQNVFAPEVWRRAVLTKARKNWPDDYPTWQREWLGRWVSEGSTYVYALNEIVANAGSVWDAQCTWKRGQGPQYNKWGLPKDQEWAYILGMDMGFEDDFAMVVVAYSPYYNTLFQVYEFKSNHLIVPQIAALIKDCCEQFDDKIEAMVADVGNLSKMVVETLNQQYGYLIEPAQKTEKNDHIELLNSDLQAGTLKILPNTETYSEMHRLQWDLRGMTKEQAVRRGKLREDSAFANHLCDALLYTWRFSYHHFTRKKQEEIAVNSPQYYQEWEDNHIQALEDAKTQHLYQTSEWTDEIEADEVDFQLVMDIEDTLFN